MKGFANYWLFLASQSFSKVLGNNHSQEKIGEKINVRLLFIYENS